MSTQLHGAGGPKTRTEYRVVYDDSLSGGLREVRNLFAPMDLDECEEIVARGNGLRIQKRTVTESPWEDIDPIHNTTKEESDG